MILMMKVMINYIYNQLHLTQKARTVEEPNI